MSRCGREPDDNPRREPEDVRTTTNPFDERSITMVRAARSKTMLALAAAAAMTALGAGSLMAEGMVGSGVSFVNAGKSTVYVYTRYGAGSSCNDMRTDKTLKIKAGQTGKVDSGDSKVCYCLALPNRTDGCPAGWQEVPAGGSLTIQ
jgi:hypothetical protein